MNLKSYVKVLNYLCNIPTKSYEIIANNAFLTVADRFSLQDRAIRYDKLYSNILSDDPPLNFLSRSCQWQKLNNQ